MRKRQNTLQRIPVIRKPGEQTPPSVTFNPAGPAPVRLIFIHHSTGENWLTDDNGDLGKA